ncbi:hypothetical protein DdX_11849 [Ditylenchus destructor]|uniref:Uncharacterized protein n=1 Tax=Ditylenchus destructor TaxID=166010 RepID=A0AAD4MWP1_9BILA|nr:hypothetical protein DdX_11849 [Ditylenchus destructor]
MKEEQPAEFPGSYEIGIKQVEAMDTDRQCNCLDTGQLDSAETRSATNQTGWIFFCDILALSQGRLAGILSV